MRPSLPEDVGYFISNWERESRPLYSDVRWAIYSDALAYHVNQLLLVSKAVVAHPPDQPSIIYAFAVGLPPVIHYVYTSPDWRRTGLARRLVSHLGFGPKDIILTSTPLTPVARTIKYQSKDRISVQPIF